MLHGTTITTSCVCSARHGCSPSPAPPLSPSASPASRTLPIHARASAHPQHDTDHPRRAQHMRQRFLIARTASTAPPARRHRVQRLTTLRSKPAPQVRRAFPAFIASPRAAPTLCADAQYLDLSRTVHATWRIAPPCSWILARALIALHLGLTASGLCVAVGYAVTEGMVGMDGAPLRSGDSHTD
ncbi:hypothetical protein K438DRAFT_1980543 [Mycena galopus ATCC 62051]|nr:hypothetical protein K438DRAFT_1980543 [Mycena galopus ATCC 62051]